MAYLTILVLYAGLMIALGVYMTRGVRRSSDFFVAGRDLGPGLLFATLLAANIGGGSTVGATGLGYRYGVSAWWWVGSAGIGSIVLALVVGPAIWRVARDRNLLTLGDYLELRFNRLVRTFAAVLVWIGSFSILAGQLIAAAWILNVTIGLQKPVGCAIGALVATVYSAAGGLHSVARVNVFQLAVKFGGFALALGYLVATGSLHAIDHDPAYRSVTGIGAPGILNYLALLGPSFVVSPGILQKVFGARDEKAVRWGVGLNSLGLLLFAGMPVLLGMIARGLFPNLPHDEMALPTLLTGALPTWLGGLLLGAVFAAEMSAADAVLLMLSTSLSRDFYRTMIRPQASDGEMVRVARASAIGCGAIGLLVSIAVPTVVAALTVFYTLLVAALLWPVIAGLYSPRTGSTAALISMVTSVGVTFLVSSLLATEPLLGMPPLLWGIAAGGIALLTGTILIPRTQAAPASAGND
jgi:SSS family solute:Na+ symporter